MLQTRLEQVELETRREVDQVAAQYERQVDELRFALRSNAEASEREKAQMLEQINELSRRSARARGGGPMGAGFWSMVGAILDMFIPMRL